jgi:hypothetical protein
MKMEQPTLEGLLSQAKAIAKQHEKIEWGAVAGALLMVCTLAPGSLPEKYTHTRAWSTVAMPDDWLVAVSGLPNISRTGLALLTDQLHLHGFVSVQDAMDFLTLEMGGERTPLSGGRHVIANSRGAEMLLARAKAGKDAT